MRFVLFLLFCLLLNSLMAQKVLGQLKSSDENTELKMVFDSLIISTTIIDKNYPPKIRCGVMTANREWIIVPFYDEIRSEGNGFLVRINDKKGFYNTHGKQVLDTLYDEVYVMYEYLFARKREYDIYSCGVFDLTGKIIYPFDYHDIKIADSLFILQAKATKDKTSKWGVQRFNKEIVTPFIYDKIIKPFVKRGQFIVSIGNQSGVIDYNGIITEPFITEINQSSRIERSNESDSFMMKEEPKKEEQDETIIKKYILFDKIKSNMMADSIMIVCKDYKWGFATLQGKLTTPLQYDVVFDNIASNSMIVSIDKQFGVVYLGKEILPCIYENILNINEVNRYVIVKNNGKVGLVNFDNQLITPYEYDNICIFQNGVAVLFKGKEKYYLKENGKISFEKPEPILVKSVQLPDYQLLNVENGLAGIRIGKQCAIIDADENIIIPLQDFTWLAPIENGLVLFIKNHKYGVMNLKQEIIIPAIYDNIYGKGNYFCVEEKFIKGVFDKKGNLIVPIKYESIEVLDDFFRCSSQNISSLLDEKGNILIPNVKGDFYFFDDDCFYTNIGGYYQYFNTKGEKTIPKYLSTKTLSAKYKSVIDSNKTVFLMKREEGAEKIAIGRYNSGWSGISLSEGLVNFDGKYFDLEGNIVIDQNDKYSKVEPFSNGYAAVKKNNKWGYINKKGEIVIPFDFDVANPFSENGLASVVVNKKTGFINAKGDVVIPLIYENPYSAYSFYKGIANPRFDDNKGIRYIYIDSKGKLLFRGKGSD
jgi:hypothetical protein